MPDGNFFDLFLFVFWVAATLMMSVKVAVKSALEKKNGLGDSLFDWGWWMLSVALVVVMARILWG